MVALAILNHKGYSLGSGMIGICTKFGYMRSENAYGYIGLLAKSFSFRIVAAGMAGSVGSQ
jgi:hypothetical protein